MNNPGSFRFLSARLRAWSVVALTLLGVAPVSRALEVVAERRGGSVVEMAARDARRYLYIRTGELPALSVVDTMPEGAGDVVVVGLLSDPLVRSVLGLLPAQQLADAVGPEGLALRKVESGGRSVLLATGVTPAGVARASARLAEELGVRFAPTGDIIPDGTVSWATLPPLDIATKPVLEVRGFFPYHSGNPEGPEYWERDDWMLFIGQSAKLGLNTISAILHHQGDGQIDASWVPSWDGPYQIAGAPFGMRKAFTADHFRSRNAALYPGAELRQQRNDANVAMVSDAYAFGRALGVEAVMGGFINGDVNYWHRVFDYLADRNFAPRYIWQHTYEDWLYTDPSQALLSSSAQGFRDFLLARDQAGLDIQAVMSGWTIGPRNDPTFYHRELPSEVIIAPQMRDIGRAPVDPAYGQMPGRPKWVVPWLEDDFNMIAPQLWVKRTADRLAVARTMGVTGILGVHWKKNVVEPQMMAMARMGWDGSLDANAFYLDYATASFGPAAGPAIAQILASVDSNLPRPTDWKDGWPGGIHPDANYWTNNSGSYAFIAQLEALEPQVQGTDSRARYATLLAHMRYLRALGQLKSAWGTGQQQAVTRQAYTRLIESITDTGGLGDLIFFNRQIQQWQPQDYQGAPRLIVRTPRTSLLKGEALELSVVLVESGTPSAATLEWSRLGVGEWQSVPGTATAGSFVVSLPAGVVAQGDFEYRVIATSSTGAQFVYPPSRSQTVIVVDPQSDLPPPVITSAGTAAALRDEPFSHAIAATNAATEFRVSGLPPGLGFDPETGVISGTPTLDGVTLLTLSASNARGTGTATLVLTVSTAESVYSANFDGGSPGGWWFYVGDGGVTSALTVASNGPAGSPALNLAVTVTAPPATYWYAGLGTTVATPPPFGPGDLAATVLALDAWVSAVPDGQINVVLKTPNGGTLSRTYTVSGGAWANLSAPLSSYANNNFDFNAGGFEIMVQRGGNGWPLASGSIRVDNVSLARAASLPAVPLIDSATAVAVVPGASLEYVITASNSPTLFGATGLPEGLAVDTATGVISGTPTALGTSLIVLSATNALGTGLAYLTLEVNYLPPVITSGLDATVKRGAVFSYQIEASPAADSFSALGLPNGLTLDATTGLISGAPTTEGVSNVTLGATNAGGTGTATLVLTVTPDGTTVRVNAGGGAVGNFAASGGFSAGSVSGPGAAVSVAGVPLAAPAAVYDTELWHDAAFTYTSPVLAEGRTFEVRLHFAERYVTAAGQRRFHIAINGATSGAGYVANFDPFVAAGNAMNRATVRVFTGVIPNGEGKITVTLSPGAAQNPMINGIEILAEAAPAPVITSAASASAAYGLPFSYTITASGGATGFGAAGLPAGLTLDTASGVISGTPTTHGVSVITLGASNAGGTGTATLTLTVTLTAIQSWRVTHFGTPDGDGAAAHDLDADGDGVVNLLEYALGGDPQAAGSAPGPALGLAGDRLNLSFFRAREELTYTVQAVSELFEEWTPIATNPGGVGETVVVEDVVELDAAGRRFLRLRVTAP